MRRAGLVALIAGSIALLPAAPAAACSSASATGMQGRLADADAAFVGHRSGHRGSAIVFRVGVRVKGRLGRRVRVHWIDTCAGPPRRRHRIGLLLHRVRGRWVATDTDVVAPGELLKTAGIGP